jgi:hypothetical protein
VIGMGHLNGDELRQGAYVPVAIRREVDRTEREAYLSANRMRSLQFVTQAGMLAASGLTAFQARLAEDVPEAANRLNAISEVAMGAIAAEIRGVMR